jgi:hypothetical protein
MARDSGASPASFLTNAFKLVECEGIVAPSSSKVNVFVNDEYHGI